jgi:LPXTG-site transpeptidase (sortase) family protein
MPQVARQQPTVASSTPVKRSSILTTAAITLVVMAAVALVYDADPVIRGELAIREAIWGPNATLAYPSRLSTDTTAARRAVPSGNRIVIPSTGIDVAIVRAKNANAGLPYGVWLDPAGGVPGAGEPVVLAGHRVRSRFAALHLVRVGDPVIVYWHGAEMDYRVTSLRSIVAANGIDMQRDAPGNGERLVLYTCLPRWMGNKRTVVTAAPYDFVE